MTSKSAIRHTACATAAAVLLALAAAGPASAARSCSLAGKQRSLGPTYTTRLTVTSTSCRAGYALVRSYYACRVRSGGRKGTCHSKVSGYSCRETRFNQISTQFDAKVTCRKGTARIAHSYTQFT